MPNRLATESSPYLLQHAQNPVEWYAWGPEALEKARIEDKPIFLSVGYSACHWCHVMERESFENEATAAIMNRHFVSIKVDREERPDVDAIYMKAVHAISGQGGWPMSVFLTPEGEPFYGGTYFPDRPRHGLPSFTQLLERIAELWDAQRSELVDSGKRLTAALIERRPGATTAALTPADASVFDAAVAGVTHDFDSTNGGWGLAPKFPQPAVIEFVLRRHLATGDAALLDMANSTLTAMAHGGIYDHLGGGFHRYTVDAIWLVPHFEKMLYDNAQLARVYLHAWQITGVPLYRRVVEETLDYVVREMREPAGGFFSAQDADSEGEEGRYFVWTEAEIEHVLEHPDDARLFMQAYGVTPGGNFEGTSILNRTMSAHDLALEYEGTPDDIEARLTRARERLLAARGSRVRPGTDDKVLTGWNGLMLSAFAEAARVLERDDYRLIAEANADFVLSHLRGPGGRLLRTAKASEAKLNGYLEDYALYAEGLLELYQSTFDPAWFAASVELAELILAHFADAPSGFFDTSDDHEQLLLRPQETQDGAMPSGGSVAAMVLAKLSAYTGKGAYSHAAEAALASMRAEMVRAPLGFASWLSALDFVLSVPSELAIVGPDALPMLRLVRSAYRPNLVVAAATGEPLGDVASDVPLLADRPAVAGLATAYLCRNFACERPVTTVDDLAALLSAQSEGVDSSQPRYPLSPRI